MDNKDLTIARQAAEIRDLRRLVKSMMIERARQREGAVETNIYDKVTRYTNCTVEVLENTQTGETSVGWYKTENTEVET